MHKVPDLLYCIVTIIQVLFGVLQEKIRDNVWSVAKQKRCRAPFASYFFPVSRERSKRSGKSVPMTFIVVDHIFYAKINVLQPERLKI